MKDSTNNFAGADPFDLARRSVALSGSPSVETLTRLASALASVDGVLRWRAAFSQAVQADQSYQSWLELELAATLQVPCAICGDPVTVPVDERRRFLLVRDEQDAADRDEQAQEYDVIAADDLFNLADLIEDEAILSIPLLCRHEICPAAAEADTAAVASEPETQQPFAGLSELLTGGKRPSDDSPEG
ncbi:MAG: YceD family protein [Burkholderiaceae bacterium]